MALFSSFSSVEQRVRTMMETGVWIVGHAARSVVGVLVARFQRKMSPTNPDAGGWVETDQDNQT